MKKIFLLSLLLLLLAVSGAAYRWKTSQWRDVLLMPFHKDQRVEQVKLGDGESLRVFAQKVRDKGLVSDSRNLLYWLTKKGADRTLKSGTYEIKSGPSWYVAQQLKDAVPTYISEIIIPGALPAKPLPFGDEKAQKEALADDTNYPEAMLKILPKDVLVRAAFLLPETYSLTEKSLSSLVRAASGAWFDKFGQAVADRNAAFRAAVIASLLQREGQRDDEYPVIAGVIENRLAKKMLLQIDASVVYAWYLLKGEVLKRVLYKHLEVDSPYNTYKHTGLPPAPICVPSAAAWEGALSPDKNDFLYYVAKGDGTHVFVKTEKEHIQNVRKYIRKK